MMPAESPKRTDPDRPCDHPDFMATVEVIRISGEQDGPVIGYRAVLRVNCAICDEAFRFVGVNAGDTPHQPMCSVDETELRAPIRPASSDPDFGMGIPGFAVRWKEVRADGMGVPR
jgi:hypothetical protein